MHHSQTSVIRVPITQKKVICTYLLTEWEGRTELYLSRGHDVRTKYVMTSRSTIHLFLYLFYFEVNPPLESMPLEIVIAV